MPTYVVECLHRDTTRPYLMIVEAEDPQHAVDRAAHASHIVSTSRPVSLSAYARRNHQPRQKPIEYDDSAYNPDVAAYFAEVRQSQRSSRWGLVLIIFSVAFIGLVLLAAAVQ